MQVKIKSAYNKYAKKWSEHIRSGKNVAQEFLEKPAMFGMLKNTKNATVLCIGCGTGEECKTLLEKGIAKKIIGIDFSEKLIEIAKKSYPEIEFHTMDIEKINLPNEKFDLIYSSLSMNYLKSWTTVLNSCYALLKDKGVFIFSSHHPSIWSSEKTKKGTIRQSVLGYEKDKSNQKKVEIYGDYLNSKLIKDVWFGEFKISYYHRPIQDLVCDIINSKFQLINFTEPKPVKQCLKIDPQFYKVHQKIPLFIIFKLRKVDFIKNYLFSLTP